MKRSTLLIVAMAVLSLAACGCDKKDGSRHKRKFWDSLTTEQKECVKTQKKQICPNTKHDTQEMKDCKKQALIKCGVKVPMKKDGKTSDKTDNKMAMNDADPTYEEIEIYEWDD